MGNITTEFEWKKLYFGKHQGKTLLQVAFNNPSYILWMTEGNSFREKYGKELCYLLKRLGHIKIPSRYGENCEVETVSNPFTKKLEDISIVPKSIPAGRNAIRENRFNYFAASIRNRHDKFGEKYVQKMFKQIILNNQKAYLTATKLEEFINDDSNFNLKIYHKHGE